MIITLINITVRMITLMMQKIKTKTLSLFIILLFTLTACGGPGMKAPSKGLKGKNKVYFESLDQEVEIVPISENKKREMEVYQLEEGDIVNITIYGQPEVFPFVQDTGPNSPYSKRVNKKGFIYFPFVGNVKAKDLTLDDLREEITLKLSKDFIDPKVDINIVKFNENRNIYIVGEVVKPSSIPLGLENFSLSQAIAKVGGFNAITASANDVFVVRIGNQNEDSKVYHADLSSPVELIVANQFLLEPKDIVFVGATNLTNFNRVISQLIPGVNLGNRRYLD